MSDIKNIVLKDAHDKYYRNSYIPQIAGGNPLVFFFKDFDIYAKFLNGKRCEGYSPFDLQFHINDIQKFILEAPRVNTEIVLYFELQYDIVDNKLKNIIKASSKLPNTKNTTVEIKIPANFPLFYLGSTFEENFIEEYLLPHGIKVEFIEKTSKNYIILALPYNN